MKNPIVITASGNTARALNTYMLFDAQFKARFPRYDIHWAYPSWTAGGRIIQRSGSHWPCLHEILMELAGEGHPWTVVQSMHLDAGNEYRRLTEVVRESPLPCSVGLPLLSTPNDFRTLVAILGPTFLTDNDIATVLVGQGFRQSGQNTCSVLQAAFHQAGYCNVRVADTEKSSGDRDQVVKELKQNGFHLVHLIPLKLVEEIDFTEDSSGNQDSWKTAFLTAGLAIIMEKRSLGCYPGVVDIFTQHIVQALDTTPLSSATSRFAIRCNEFNQITRRDG